MDGGRSATYPKRGTFVKRFLTMSAVVAVSVVTLTSAAIAAPHVTYTKPGKQLHFKQLAVIPFEVGHTQGAIGVTVMTIQKGKPADLKPLHLGKQVAGLTPYYLRFKIVNWTGGQFQYTDGPGSMSPLLADGSHAGAVVASGSFPKCQDTDSGPDDSKKGFTYTSCAIAVAGPGQKVTGVAYGAEPISGFKGSPNYVLKPIVWKH
jgi:hypothetical protein